MLVPVPEGIAAVIATSSGCSPASAVRPSPNTWVQAGGPLAFFRASPVTGSYAASPCHFSWFASAFDTADWVYRLTTMVQMVGVIILALGLPPMFASIDHGPTLDNSVMVLGYVVMRVAMVAQWLRAARQSPERRRACLTAPRRTPRRRRALRHPPAGHRDGLHRRAGRFPLPPRSPLFLHTPPRRGGPHEAV